MKALEGRKMRVDAEDLARRATALRNEIALAKERRAGIQRAIDSREKTLARLDAQLLLVSPAGQSASLVEG